MESVCVLVCFDCIEWRNTIYFEFLHETVVVAVIRFHFSKLLADWFEIFILRRIVWMRLMCVCVLLLLCVVFEKAAVAGRNCLHMKKVL